MKKILSVVLFLTISASIYSQNYVPNFVSFQGVARDTSGVTVNNQAILVQLIYTTGTGNLFFSCTFQKTTDAIGEFTVQVSDNSPDIKSGTSCTNPFSAPFSTLPWDTGNIYLTVLFQTTISNNWDTLGTIQLGATYYAYIAAKATQAANGVPPGTILSFAGDTDRIPAGYLLCDGRPFQQAAYPDLYAAIGTAWGNGGHSTTWFNLPDLRGMFLRGVDKSLAGTVTGNDPDANARYALNSGNFGNNVGSYESDTLKSHVHSVYAEVEAANGSDPAASNASSTNHGTNPFNTSATGGSETRPKNAYVYYIIKF